VNAVAHSATHDVDLATGIAALGLALYTLLHPGARVIRRSDRDKGSPDGPSVMATLEDPGPRS